MNPIITLEDLGSDERGLADTCEQTCEEQIHGIFS